MFQFAHLQDWNLTSWVGVILICYVLFLALDVLYNIFLHPLSKFPGPLVAAASHVPYAYASVHGRHPYWVKSLHDRYDSPVVRISPRELSFINAEVWHDVFGKGGSVYEKDLAVYPNSYNGVDSLLTANVDDHQRMRSVLKHAFSDRALREHEPVVDGYISLLINRLHGHIHEGGGVAKVDVLNWYTWTTFDIMGDLAFGDKFECLQNQNLHPWVKTVQGYLQFAVYRKLYDRFGLSRWLGPLLIPKRIKQMAADSWMATMEKVGQRMELGTKRPDFFSEILKFNSNKMGLSKEEIQSNAFLFMIAGTDSGASWLSATTFHLLQNPAVMKKLTDEVCDAFKSEAEFNGQRLSKLPYLVACLDETLRIYPPSTGQAVVVPPGGDTIGNHWVPGGTGIANSMYAMHHSEKNFKDPELFVPERWLGDPRYACDNRDVFHPFSHGARSCIGKNLGTMEIRLLLARMIWNFKIELCEETDLNWMDQKAFHAFAKKPLIVRLKPRSRSASS